MFLETEDLFLTGGCSFTSSDGSLSVVAAAVVTEKISSGAD